MNPNRIPPETSLNMPAIPPPAGKRMPAVPRQVPDTPPPIRDYAPVYGEPPIKAPYPARIPEWPGAPDDRMRTGGKS